MNQIKKIEKQPTSVISVLNSDAFQNRMRQVLPEFLKPERIAGIAITELRNNQKLLQCDALSLVGAIIRAGQLGLDIDSMKGHAYLVPYKNECQLIVGYKGMLTLANRSGKLLSMEVQEVRENDEFEIEHVTTMVYVTKLILEGLRGVKSLVITHMPICQTAEKCLNTWIKKR